MTAPLDAPRRRLPRPRGHWIVLTLVATGLLVALLANGYAGEEVGRSSSAPPAHDRAVTGMQDAGPVIDFSGDQPRSVRSPDRTVALTFDDGPDPRWTPAILDVLRREHVHATFFVVGSRVAAHPRLLHRIVDGGHEVGSHTFTHTDLGRLPAWRANLELSLTQLAIGGADGVHTGLFRMPYSSTPADITRTLLRGQRLAAAQGYLGVLADRDSEDWRRPGVDRIVANALPEDGAGAVILLHDGGGDRSQTLAALPRLIDRLRADGYRFTTVSQLAGIRRDAVIGRVGGVARLQGVGLLVVLRVAAYVTRALALLTILVALLAVARTLVLTVFARRHARRAGLAERGDFRPPVSIVVPAYNEAVGIAEAVRSLARSHHPDVEVIVVDDGSTDDTAAIVAGLGEPNVVLVRQANAGKPGALNTGIAHARHDIIVTVDGDTVFEPGTVSELVQQFRDPSVGAVSGNTKVGNRRGLLGRWQHIEYVMGFNLDRRLFDLLDCMPTVPGAVGAFRRETLAEIGGVSNDTLAEDTDLTMAINRAGWRVVYEERARAWTEAPSTLGALWRQRYRWCYGTMQSIWKHRAALRRRERGAGHLGRVGLPYLLLFQVALPLLAPVFDLFALYGLLFLDARAIAAWWLAFNALQLGVALYAFRLDDESPRPLWALPLQQFVYRQLTYLVVIQSLVSALAGTRLGWHKLRRTGDVRVLPTGGETR